MKKKIKMLLIIFVSVIVVFALIVFGYFFIGNPKQAENIRWGVDFSQMQTETLGLNWKEAFLATINDLGAKNIKLHTQWDWVEGQKDDYFWDDIDWQIKTAQENDVKIIYVLGVKTGRWPECHTPSWLPELSATEQQQKALDYIKQVVERYKNNPAIEYWQVENEPLFNFGKCPNWYYDGGKFLQKEIELVKQLDPGRKVIVSDSGEQSLWTKPAKIADIVGVTMYRKVWFHVIDGIGFYYEFPLRPVSYLRKSQLISKLFNKPVICIELQAEPWTESVYADSSLEEQEKTMDINQFKKNVEYAKATGLDTFYLWGVEWWYWMKETQNRPEFWQEAQKLFQ